MTISFPYPKANFADLLKIKSAVFSPSYGQEYSGQASGTIRVKDLRPALWKADITTVQLRFDDANDIQAVLESLDGSIQSFYLYNPMRPYFKTGQVVLSSTVKINSLSTDGKSLSLNGLPSRKVVSRGDMISFPYGSRPSIALHRVLETVTASSLGITAAFQVSNGIRTGVSTGTLVTVNKAYGEFRMLSPFTQNSESNITASYQFTAIQVL